MTDRIRHQMKMQKVREMKNPKIFLNVTDYNILAKSLGDNVRNVSIDGLQIISASLIERGKVVILDDQFNFL